MEAFVSNSKKLFMAFIKSNVRTTLLLLFITAIAAVRVIFNFSPDISPLANFSPLGAMALFGGAYFKKQWKAFALPLLMLFISDLILQQTVFKAYGNGVLYDGWYWVYGAFALITLAAGWLLRKLTIKNFIIAVLVSVAIHWVVTDIGVWYGSKIFTQNIQGYIDCLIVAIPYELRFLSGTIIYGAVLFGLFEWMQQRYPNLKTA
jgi:hypothetical protein